MLTTQLNDYPLLPIFLISLKAGGFGLNLTAASPLVGPRFVDLTEVYSRRLRAAFSAAFADVVERRVLGTARPFAARTILILATTSIHAPARRGTGKIDAKRSGGDMRAGLGGEKMKKGFITGFFLLAILGLSTAQAKESGQFHPFSIALLTRKIFFYFLPILEILDFKRAA